MSNAEASPRVCQFERFPVEYNARLHNISYIAAQQSRLSRFIDGTRQNTEKQESRFSGENPDSGPFPLKKGKGAVCA